MDGKKIVDPTGIKFPSQRNLQFNATMERRNFPGKINSQGASFRFLPGGMGRSRCDLRANGPRILEEKKAFTHKCQGAGSSNKYSSIIGKNWGTCYPKSGQFSGLLVPDQGGEDPQLKSIGKTFPKMVHGKANKSPSSPSEKFRGFGRWPQQMAQRQGGLHLKPWSFSTSLEQNAKISDPLGRHLCLPRQSSVAIFLWPDTPIGKPWKWMH